MDSNEDKPTESPAQGPVSAEQRFTAAGYAPTFTVGGRSREEPRVILRGIEVVTAIEIAEAHARAAVEAERARLAAVEHEAVVAERLAVIGRWREAFKAAPIPLNVSIPQTPVNHEKALRCIFAAFMERPAAELARAEKAERERDEAQADERAAWSARISDLSLIAEAAGLTEGCEPDSLVVYVGRLRAERDALLVVMGHARIDIEEARGLYAEGCNAAGDEFLEAASDQLANSLHGSAPSAAEPGEAERSSPDHP